MSEFKQDKLFEDHKKPPEPVVPPAPESAQGAAEPALPETPEAALARLESRIAGAQAELEDLDNSPATARVYDLRQQIGGWQREMGSIEKTQGAAARQAMIDEARAQIDAMPDTEASLGHDLPTGDTVDHTDYDYSPK